MLFKVLFALVLCISLAEANQILAVVNGNNITTDVAPTNFATLDIATKHQLVDRLVEKKLAADYALHTDIINDKAFQKSFEHIMGFSKPASKKEISLKGALTTQGYTPEQLESKKGLLAFDFLIDQKAKSFVPSEQALQAYFEKHKYSYDAPAKVELSAIVVETPQKAQEVLDALHVKCDFETFSALARQYSIAPDAKEGGYLGKIPRFALNDEVAHALDGLKQGEYTPTAFHGEFGYQIYYLINDIPQIVTTLDMVHDRVKEEWTHEEVKTWAMQTIAALKHKATIVLKPLP